MSPLSPSPAAWSPLLGPPHWWEHGWSRFSLAAFPGPAVSDSRRTYLQVGRGLPPGEESFTGGFCLGLQVDLPPSFLCGMPPVTHTALPTHLPPSWPIRCCCLFPPTTERPSRVERDPGATSPVWWCWAWAPQSWHEGAYGGGGRKPAGEEDWAGAEGPGGTMVRRALAVTARALPPGPSHVYREGENGDGPRLQCSCLWGHSG